MSKIYITTSIPYVNAAPHVGFALELVQADAYARHFRLLGHDIRFQCGTDDNSLKNVRSAEAAGVQVKDFVDANAYRFEHLGGLLDISNEEFVRTSHDPRHIACVHALWRACAGKGDLYRKAYEGLYCVGCEQFYEPSELDDGRCPEHGIALETIREENWFFRLSRYGDRLIELIETGELRIVPAHRRNEILALLRRGLTDISVSRSAERARGWGVPISDGDEVVYVWFDALANYLTGLGHGSDETLLQRYWNDGQRIHVVGKGISKFHAIYWPAILLSAGLPPPSSILVHGYVTVDGRKIGKSAGNGIDPERIIQTYGTPDALRYYLLRHIRSGDDGDFSAERLEAAWSGELAGQLGNLANRVLALLSTSFGGIVPPVPDSAFVDEAARLPGKVAEAFDAYELHVGLADIFAFIGEANRRFTKGAPWADAKALLADLTPEDRRATAARLSACLAEQVYGLAVVARCLLPFLPSSAATLHSRLGIPAPRLYQDPLILAGVKAAPQAVLFPQRAAA
ncbi:methionine--tRNA ligase [Rhizobium johnstonii]|uniref:methionine--tRNA ligase n=1 Tax=Rhizobium TaxID=379 RepID=UPI0013C18DC1|nr:methionine--tRNA ligase [Rhizobium leguminosarum]WSG96308.1 methionine--tRNA ligase [Rhizobium johnstonii]MBB4505609.1 methionyl-tRNA synthetase [Rhizobium leguminosarum]NEH98578.1 methionine--tRNA ligase [Rhizobium leguminosarum]NEJ41662.1 methionine--tRNA ligase [Rhizobium leguminosarum]NEJ47770.1 methionine--tRNA ligase [Rhizobium leguminosarum]